MPSQLGTLLADRDLTVLAYGNITGNYSTSNRDLAAVAYGSFTGSVSAGRDLVSLTAVGDISGFIGADNTIHEVMSYGDIQTGTFITAPNITEVKARGNIGGPHLATTTYDTLAAGGALSATFLGVSPTNISESDPALASLPTPATPPSQMGTLMTDAAAAQAEVLAACDELDTFFAEFAEEMATLLAETGGDIATARAEIAADVAEATGTTLPEARDTARENFETTLTTRRETLAGVFDQLVTAAATAEARIDHELQGLQQRQDARFNGALAVATRANNEFAAADLRLGQNRADVLVQAAADAQRRNQQWNDLPRQLETGGGGGYWSVFFTHLPGAMADSYHDGRMWDSVQGAATEMVDTMFLGLTNFAGWIPPIAGNHAAHAGGRVVGKWWGTANTLVLGVGASGAFQVSARTQTLLYRYTLVDTTVAASRGTYAALTGQFTWWNVLDFAPAVGEIAGRALRQLRAADELSVQIGAADNAMGSGRQMLDLPVTQQPSANTCVASCLDMLLPGRPQTIIDNHTLRPGGMNPADMVAFLDDNFAAAGLQTMRGSVEEAIASGNRFLAVVDDGHAVVVDGVRNIEGIQHVIVRDPAVGAYLEPLDWFLERVVQAPDVLSFPAIWGQ